MAARSLIAFVLLAGALLSASGAKAALFEDDEARKAILDLRQRVEGQRLATERYAEDLRKSNEDNTQLRRSLLDLQTQIEALRSEIARMHGQD
jgi:septal ring factor EnvC (AmiA/AmiB activator)